MAKILILLTGSAGFIGLNVYQRLFQNHIGEGKPVNLREYLGILENILQKKAIIESAPMNKEEMISTFADCSRLFDFIGFKPTTTVEKGLEKTVDWYLSYQGEKK